MKRLQKRVLIGLLLSITTLIGGINLPVLANSADENGGNLITDGGFDATSDITNGNWWENAPETGSWQYSGDNAVVIETDGNTSNNYATIVADTGLGQNTKVELNTTYVLTAKVKGGAATLSINNGSAQWCAGNNNRLQYTEITASEDWQTVTLEYNNESYAKLFVYLWVTDGNTVYIDDVSLTAVITIDADKTAQWVANSEDSTSYDLRIHGWETWENAAYIGFDLGEKLNDYVIQKAELVITTTGVKNDDNHSNYPKAWLYGATYSAFDNKGQYQGTDNAPAYNTDAILEFDSPTEKGASRYDVTEYIKSQIETGNAAFRIDVKSQKSNNQWTIGSCNNGGQRPQLVITVSKKPVINAFLNSAEIPDITIPEKVTEINNGEANGTANWSDVVGNKTLNTVLIKIKNPTENAVPSVKRGEQEYKPTKTDIANENSDGSVYFIYQFAGIDVSDAEVLYPGADAVTLKSDSAQ